nr:MAG TPA: hypothetical protein [Microviridae sp.]
MSFSESSESLAFLTSSSNCFMKALVFSTLSERN